MKRIFLKILVIPFLMLVAHSCKKETLSSEEVNDNVTQRPGSPGGCQLTSYLQYNGFGDYIIETFSYTNGLVSEIIPSYGWRYTMQYDAHKRLISSKAYIDDMHVANIYFIYEKNRVVEEIWEEPNTLVIEDRWYYTYDQRGNLIENRSFIQDVYTAYTYYNNGSLKSNQIFISDIPWFKAEYTYEENIKNPYLSVTGISHSFYYTNAGFGKGLGQRWYTSEKITAYDEEGHPINLYAQDPTQTTWEAGTQHLPLEVNYVDSYTQTPMTNAFTYENCNNGHSKPFIQSKHLVRNKNGKVGKSIFMLPQYEVIQRIKDN